MKGIGALRILAGIASLPLIIWTLFVIRKFNSLGASFSSPIVVLAILCWWFALRGHILESRKQMGLTIMGGVVGFLFGFLGPGILRPDAPDAVLLVIFFTGPLGFVLGSIVCFVWARFRMPRWW